MQWLYHRGAWKDGILDDYPAITLDHLLSQQVSHLKIVNERKRENRLVQELAQILIDDCFKILDLLDRKALKVLYSSSPETVRRLVWVDQDGRN